MAQSPKRFVGWAVLSGLLATALAVAAQDSTSPPSPAPESKPRASQGSVTGTVYCADTNLPARLASVILTPDSDGAGGPKTATTDLDGRFAIRNVKEGRYFITAELPGYLNPLSGLNAKKRSAMTAEARKEFEARLTAVIVSPNKPAEASLRLERAAEIDGTVVYDDGSPAIGLRVRAESRREPDAKAPEPGLAVFPDTGDETRRVTDDRGRFRILGVPPGEYLVSVAVPTASVDRGNPFIRLVESSPLGSLTVYSGGALRASKAKAIKIGPGGALADAEITIPLSTLHTVRGQVILKSTGQPPPAAAVVLLYADTREVMRVTVAGDGDFEFPYIPEDSFVLLAAGSADALPTIAVDEEDAGIPFLTSGAENLELDPEDIKGAAELPLRVSGDLSGVTIAVPDPAPPKPEQSAQSQGDSATQTVVPQ